VFDNGILHVQVRDLVYKDGRYEVHVAPPFDRLIKTNLRLSAEATRHIQAWLTYHPAGPGPDTWLFLREPDEAES
jgi:hypothetical protein